MECVQSGAKRDSGKCRAGDWAGHWRLWYILLTLYFKVYLLQCHYTSDY